MQMSSRRKTDLSESDIDYLQTQMSLLAKSHPVDAKSFLLLIKSLMPNSLRLKLIEYRFAKDNEDVLIAAQLLSQLCASHHDSLREEVNHLFDEIKCSPPNKISVDIFTNLTPTAQRNVLTIYFEHYVDNVTKADILMGLLHVQSILDQNQLVPTLLTWASDTLRDGERILLNDISKECEDGSDSSKICPDLMNKVSEPMDLTSDSNNEPVAIYNDDNDDDSVMGEALSVNDEGEEGEVIVDDDDFDDDDEEEDDETGINVHPSASVHPGLSSSVVGKYATNIYRFKMAYELLPLLHKVRRFTKLDQKLVDEMVSSSLNFFFNYLTFIPLTWNLLGTEKCVQDLSSVTPRDCLNKSMCLVSDIYHWPESVLICATESTTRLKDPITLFHLLQTCLDRIAQLTKQLGTLSKKRRSSSGRKSVNENQVKLRSLVIQTACLFWYIVVSLSFKHFERYRPFIFSTCGVDQRICYPINLSHLFGHAESIKLEVVASEQSSPEIIVLSQLFQLCSYSDATQQYSLGHKDVDHWISLLAPPPPLFASDHNNILHLLPIDLALLCPQSETCFPSIIKAKFPSAIYPSSQRMLLSWLSSAHMKNLFDSPNMSSVEQLQSHFVRNLQTIVQLAPVIDDHDDDVPVDFQPTCWMIPFTQSALTYFGCRLVVHWLVSRSSEPQSRLMDCMCYSSVLAQIDSQASSLSRIFGQLFPIPYAKCLGVLREHWPEARPTFYAWLQSSDCVLVDSGLLNQLISMESAYRRELDGAIPTFEDMVDLCVERMKSADSTSLGARLCTFIHSEAASILACLT